MSAAGRWIQSQPTLFSLPDLKRGQSYLLVTPFKYCLPLQSKEQWKGGNITDEESLGINAERHFQMTSFYCNTHAAVAHCCTDLGIFPQGSVSVSTNLHSSGPEQGSQTIQLPSYGIIPSAAIL